MNKNLDFETYLLVSPQKYLISIEKKINFENIFRKEKTFEKKIDKFNLVELNNFLNENIYNTEKYLNNFIKEINLILDCNDFFHIQLSLKMNNHGELLTNKNLDHLLNEAKNQCRNTFIDKKIIHVIVDNYLVDNKSYDFMPQKLNCNFFSIDVSFICLSNNFIKPIEDVVKKYQISINKIISLKYMKELFLNEDLDVIKMAKDTIDGYNQNEVVLISKKAKNIGFFEKFFHFFS